jgi:hypothetical protein
MCVPTLYGEQNSPSRISSRCSRKRVRSNPPLMSGKTATSEKRLESSTWCMLKKTEMNLCSTVNRSVTMI